MNDGLRAFSEIVRCSAQEDSFELLLSAIQLYLDLLHNEASTIQLASGTLPSLKILLDHAYERVPDTPTYARLIHNLLSAALGNMDEIR